MGHYLIEYDDEQTANEVRVVAGPVTAINPEEAVRQSIVHESEVTTVWPVEDDSTGKPDSYPVEELDL